MTKCAARYSESLLIKTITLSVLTLTLLASPFAQASGLASLKEIEDRAADYDKFFYGGGAPAKYLDTRITPGLAQTRELMTVMPGVLYRGGGPGGTHPLPSAALQALCEAGFSTAIYAYTDNWTAHSPTTCTSKISGKSNTLDYISLEASSDSGKKTTFARIQRALEDATVGPVFVHCWNGFHASGELAATSLRQYCPSTWTGDKASAYWLRHSDGAPLISRIKKFVPMAGFEIPADYQASLCQQTQ